MKAPIYVPVSVFVLFATAFLLERRFPLRNTGTSLFSRLIVNLAFSGLVFLIAAAVVQPSTLSTLQWVSKKPFGLVNLFPIGRAARFIIGFLLLDLSFYYWHVANHKIPVLWRFHNVHHLDPDLDVSTGFRFHFGEVLFSTIFRVLQVAVIGVPFGTFVCYELVFQGNTLFEHSNVRLPIRFERILNKVLVTPRMHGIHHSQIRTEANSNFGVVFAWWDKLHRTIFLNIPQASLEIGIPGYSAPHDNK